MSADLISLTQAAQLANCDRTTVWRAIQRGQLSGELVKIQFNHEVYMVHRADVELWAAARRKKEKEPSTGN